MKPHDPVVAKRLWKELQLVASGVGQSEEAVARLVVVGHVEAECGAQLLSDLQQLPGCRVLAEFSELPQALAVGRELLQSADVVVVLQNWSDEFTSGDVIQLIGLTYGRRLWCCYGPWCESDGRNYSIWPVANRVPLRLAGTLLRAEVQRWRQGQLALPPTAAAEEVFAERTAQMPWLQGTDSPLYGGPPLPSAQLEQAVLVISSDEALRVLVNDICRVLRRQLLMAGLQSAGIVPELLSAAGPVHCILHDLDDVAALVQSSVRHVRRQWPQAALVGVSSAPALAAAVPADVPVSRVLPRLDLVTALMWYLQSQ